MKYSHKALLYSALIFPGCGHFLLKRYALGSLFAATATACVFALLSTAIDLAQSISARILSGEIPFDIARISSEVSLQAQGAGSTTVTVATWLLVACWIFAGIDAFRLGRHRDLAGNADPAA